jgi:hypothetical protein
MFVSLLSLELRNEGKTHPGRCYFFSVGWKQIAENDARFSFSRALPVLIVAVVLVYLVPIQLFSQKIGLHLRFLNLAVQ